MVERKFEKEDGEATIIVDLRGSIITVYHNDTNEILYKGVARKGTWDKIWKEIKNE